MGDIADRLVIAAEVAVVDIRDAYPRDPKDAPSEEVAARAVAAVLRELDVIVGEAFWRGAPGPDLVVLADEIDQEEDR